MKTAHTIVKVTAILTVLFVLLMAATIISAASGTPRMQAYFPTDFKDDAYQQKAYEKVAKGWLRPTKTPAAGAKAVVIATIARDGSVASTTLHMKSGEAAWDEAAVAAVKKASPLSPIPPSYPNAATEVHFHFEWVAAPAKP